MGGAFLFCASGEAHAFCRTTTTSLPAASYDASLSGVCWMMGVPLAWPGGMSIPYSLAAAASVQVSLADATRVADASFATWTSTICPAQGTTADAGFVPVHIQAYDNGPVDAAVAAADCGPEKCASDVHDTHHLIIFHDTDWPYSDQNNTLALTTVTYGVDTGTIYDADIEINSSVTQTKNSSPHYLSAVEPPTDLPANTFDLQSILTHEAGHFFGLAHAPASTNAVMYAFYSPGSIALTQDDIDGICTVYPEPRPPSSGCSCESAPAPSSLPAAAAVLGVTLLAWKRKRRKSS